MPRTAERWLTDLASRGLLGLGEDLVEAEGAGGLGALGRDLASRVVVLCLLRVYCCFVCLSVSPALADARRRARSRAP